jgi:hypothetical protein
MRSPARRVPQVAEDRDVRRDLRTLARPSSDTRVLCGDFNSPQTELPTGEVVTWGQRIRPDGVAIVRHRTGPRRARPATPQGAW